MEEASVALDPRVRDQMADLRPGPLAVRADLGKPEDLEPLLRRPLDLLICELAHFSPEQIFSYLEGKPIKQVVFVHLSRACLENLTNIRRLADKRLPHISVSFARDGDEIQLAR